MAIIGSFNGRSIIAVPSDVDAHCAAPNSIKWTYAQKVASTESPFTGSQQIFDWQQGLWMGELSFNAMQRCSADKWAAFIQQCRGNVNCFAIGDPKAKTPKGKPLGVPVVNGAAQTGYTLLTRGWTANAAGVLLAGDYISILSGPLAPRLYQVQDTASADGSGDAAVLIWPPLRESPADGTAIGTANCTGLFCLAANDGLGISTTVSDLYGVSALAIREAL